MRHSEVLATIVHDPFLAWTGFHQIAKSYFVTAQDNHRDRVRLHWLSLSPDSLVTEHDDHNERTEKSMLGNTFEYLDAEGLTLERLITN